MCRSCLPVLSLGLWERSLRCLTPRRQQSWQREIRDRKIVEQSLGLFQQVLGMGLSLRLGYLRLIEHLERRPTKNPRIEQRVCKVVVGRVICLTLSPCIQGRRWREGYPMCAFQTRGSWATRGAVMAWERAVSLELAWRVIAPARNIAFYHHIASGVSHGGSMRHAHSHEFRLARQQQRAVQVRTFSFRDHLIPHRIRWHFIDFSTTESRVRPWASRVRGRTIRLRLQRHEIIQGRKGTLSSRRSVNARCDRRSSVVFRSQKTFGRLGGGCLRLPTDCIGPCNDRKSG